MSSGTLPLGTYHRANALGAGTYGSVVQVYDEDGNEYALKLFEEEEEDDDDDSEQESSDSSDHEENESDEDEILPKPLDLGALREISILRLLRHENSHPNIVSIHDVKQASGTVEDQGQVDRLMQYPGITMKLYQYGTLSKIVGHNLDKKTKVGIAHGILSGVAYLHENGIIHRDIKADNIMMDIDCDGAYTPVLIDFSLSKIILPQCIYGSFFCQEDASISNGNEKNNKGRKVKARSFEMANFFTDLQGEDTHTPNVGTPTYRAPECVSGKSSYGLPSDMYSVGVVLLELLRGSCIESFKDRGASIIVESELESLPNQPFANLIRGLLERDPKKRTTARDALQHQVFKKYGFAKEDEKCAAQDSIRTIDIQNALPLDGIENDSEGFLDGKDWKKRRQLIQKIANDLDATHPFTVQAAFCYSLQLSQLDDCIDDLSQSQGLIDCVVLAHKFFEKELWNLKDIERLDRGIFQNCHWSASDYIDTEETIWMLMDFCLYPRKLWI
jgi:serine/threonine protein kinase